MYIHQMIYKHFMEKPTLRLFIIIPRFYDAVKQRKSGGDDRRRRSLLLAEGFAVGALIHRRILLMSADKDAVKRAVVFAVAVISTLLNGAFDALVCLAVHNTSSFLLGSEIVCPLKEKKYGKNFPFLQFIHLRGMIIKKKN